MQASFIDILVFAWRALSGHRLRTGLSLLGMTIGVAAVIVLTALGEGARLYVTGQFTNLGSNLVIVVPGRNETTGAVPGVGGVANDLTLDDARAVKRRVRQIRRIAPITVATETVSARRRSAGRRHRQVAVIGTTRDYFTIRQLPVARGEPLPEGDLGRAAPVVVLGAETARELFGQGEAIGAVVRVGSWRMRVVGVLESKGVQLGVDLDDLVIVPVATAMRMFNIRSLFRLIGQVDSPAELDAARDGILEVLAERHGEEDVTCLTQDAVVSTLSSILNALTAAIGAIGAVSLSVAGIGIMNVMLVSVSERTAEVGLLKALGAYRRQILAVFLTEAALLSTAGGALGLAVGWAAVQVIVAVYPAMPARPPVWAVVAAAAVSIGMGLVFGVLPARLATDLDPVAALGRGLRWLRATAAAGRACSRLRAVPSSDIPCARSSPCSASPPASPQ